MTVNTVRSHRYEFANGNEYVTHANPYSMGRALLAEGNLPEAIKALEAEVQRNGDNSDAWLALGLVRAAPVSGYAAMFQAASRTRLGRSPISPMQPRSVAFLNSAVAPLGAGGLALCRSSCIDS